MPEVKKPFQEIEGKRKEKKGMRLQKKVTIPGPILSRKIE
jgi:hypothetical protein